MNDLKILIISTSHPYKAAGIVAKDILDGFRGAGFETKLLVKSWGRFKDEDIYSFDNYIATKVKWFKRSVNYFAKHIGLKKTNQIKTDNDYSVQDIYQTKNYIKSDDLLDRVGFTPDIIFIIFAQKFLSAKNIYELQQITGAPVYWQLADMASFTGLCHYAWDCTGYLENCGHCPAIYSKNSTDISRDNLIYKKHYFDKTKLHILIGSDWLIERAKQSSIFCAKRISKVYLSIDKTLFQPSNDSDLIRNKYKIPSDAFVIGFGAVGIKAKRKGIKYILESISILEQEESGKNICLVYAGTQQLEINTRFKTIYLGNLNRNDLPVLYHCSDVFVSASLQDVGPYTIIEALMCGIPVVSFNTGFANDFVKTDETGVLTDKMNAEALAKGIKQIMMKTEDEYKQLKKDANLIVKNRLTIERQINSYIDLFKGDGII